MGRDLPVTIVLKHLIQHSFPEEYEERRKEEAELGAGGEGGAAELPIPLFVMHSCLPGMSYFFFPSLATCKNLHM